MKLSHVNVLMPKGGEEIARNFYHGLLGLAEIPRPEMFRDHGGIWFDAGGLDIHLSEAEKPGGPDTQRHFGLACLDAAALRTRLEAAGVVTSDGRPAPWKRFFVNDPFGSRIEIHEAGALCR